jgi:hypothetical protein
MAIFTRPRPFGIFLPAGVAECGRTIFPAMRVNLIDDQKSVIGQKVVLR